MPLRAQPGLARQARLYAALEELHANHLGTYVDVVEPGEIRVGDEVAVA
jgi:MOSC domain-containing protein YiiM